MVGSPLKVPLGVTNAERDGRVKLVKKEGPEGIRVTNSELTWLPQAKDVGIQTVGLEVIDPVDGTILDRTKMTLHIKLPKVDVGFAIKTMQRCPDNRFAVLWGPSKGQESRHPAHTGSDDIAIVDLGARSVLAKKSMPSGIRTAAIDEKHVYLAPNSGNLFYRTDHGLSNHKRQFLKSAPQQLVRFVSNRLAVTGGALELFDSEKMKPVTLLALSALEPQRPTVAAQGDNVMRVGGRLIDRHDGKILRLDARSYLPCAITTSNSNQRVTPSSTILPWGRIVKGNQIANYRGSTIAQWSGSQGQIGALSTKYPMAVVVRSTVDSTTREIQIVLELRDLIDGEIKHSAVMDAQPASRAGRSPNFYGTRELLAVSDDSVIFVNRSELLIAEIPVEIASKMPVPVHFLAQQTTEIEVGKSVQIPLRVGGDSDGTQFTLMAEYTGLTLNPDSGVMTVDTSEIWESFVEANKGINTSYIRNRSGETASLLDQAENAKRYEALTGKKLARGKLAAYLPISSVLQDKEGQQDGVHFTVVVVGPRGPLDRAIAQRQAELKALQERQMEERRKAQEAREKQLAQRNAGAEMTQKRLDDLEASMRRMQVTLDKILERLEKED